MNASDSVMTMAAAFGFLWVVTMALAGALGKALYGKLDAMEGALEDIAETASKLAVAAARTEERHDALRREHDALAQRVERIEDRRAS